MMTIIGITTVFIFLVLLIDAVDEDNTGEHLRQYKVWNNLVQICLMGFWVLVGLAIVAIAINSI